MPSMCCQRAVRYVTRGQRYAVGAAREVASVLVDDAFADGPRRLFADSC